MKYRINGKEVRRRRLNAGMLQRELAAECGIDDSHLCKIERDTLPCRHLPIALNLAVAFGCQITDLVTTEECTPYLDDNEA